MWAPTTSPVSLNLNSFSSCISYTQICVTFLSAALFSISKALSINELLPLLSGIMCGGHFLQTAPRSLNAVYFSVYFTDFQCFYALGFKQRLLSTAPRNQHNRTSFCSYFAKFMAKELKVRQYFSHNIPMTSIQYFKSCERRVLWKVLSKKQQGDLIVSR